jgi:hydrogenase/urease accessory protein HupE
MRNAALAAFAATAVLAITFYAVRADAHAIGLSSGEYTARGSALVGKLAFARGEVASLAPSLDANRDGHVTASEVEASRSLLKEKVLARVEVTAGGQRCTPNLTDAGLTEQDGLLLSARWDCPAAAETLEVELALLDDLARGHRHVARTIGATSRDDVLYGDHRRLTIAGEAASSPGAASSPSAAPRDSGGRGTSGTSVWSFFKMGIEHILTGYDHLVFILGLVLARARLRALLSVVTAFTIAHSITLALAVLNVWAPSSRIVEPAIALSIAYVGIENFFVKDASKRWRITFPFGLVHGFGFAGALQEIALPRSDVPGALISFNLGVEAGQLSVLALLLPLLWVLRGKTWFEPLGVRLVSGAVAVAGGIWFVARVVG